MTDSYILDTCFVLWEAEHNGMSRLREFCKRHETFMTSFNLEELERHEKHKHHVKKEVEGFLKDGLVHVFDVPLSPGQRDEERAYANEIPGLLDAVKDPSDAVLVRAAIVLRASIVTRDKHDLFRPEVEEFLKGYDIRVLNEISRL